MGKSRRSGRYRAGVQAALCGLLLITLPLQAGTDAVTGAAQHRSPVARAAGDDTDATWLDAARRQIVLREYEAGMSAQGLQAPSRRHGFRTYFEPAGIRVTDRTDPDAAPLFTLRLARIGRPGAMAAVAPGRVASQGARVEIERDAVREWYTNSPAGLEQGFSLAARRAGAGPLLLELALEGAAAVRQGDAVRITTTTGRTLSYGRLQAFDARGAGLQAELRVSSPHRLQLRVDDRAAVYPISVDPLLTATAETLLESDQAYALFGFSVAAAGDVNGDGYGDVIVGAWRYDAGAADTGAAFVFLGSAAGIADATPARAHVRIDSDQAGAELGEYVAGAGDVNGDGYDDVIVGAWHYDAGETDEGAAFVFLGSAAGIPDGAPAAAQARLEGDQAQAEFGVNVGGAGDVNGDGYDDVIVGAWHYDAAAVDDGSAFIFLGSADGITGRNPATAATRLQGGQAGAQLGISVDGAGDVNGDGYDDVIVGAHTFDTGAADAGVAGVFLGSRNGVGDASIATAHARITGDQVEAWLGCNVSGAGDVNGDGYDDVIVGARRYDVGDWTDAGAAFVFLGSPAGLSDGSPESAQTRLLGDQDGGWLGYAVDAVGDINGDGYGDVIVGAGRYDTAREDDGAAFLFAGSAGGIADAGPASAYARFESGQARAYLGSAVAGAGDVDGDGVGDFIVGAYQYDCGQTNEGAAFVIPGGRLAPADSGGQAVAALGERCGAAAVELPFRKRTAALVLLAGIVVLLGLRYLRRRTTG